MSFDEPDQVGSGEYLKPEELLNHLVMVWAVSYIEHSPTIYTRPDKLSDVIVVDCVDLDSAQEPGGKLYRRCWWRNAKLIGALRGKIGSANPMLAVMALGIPTKGKPPYELISATRDPESVARANIWLSMNPDFKPSQPQAHLGTATEATPAQQAPAPVQRAPAPNETMLERMARIAQGAGLPPRPPADDADIPF